MRTSKDSSNHLNLSKNSGILHRSIAAEIEAESPDLIDELLRNETGEMVYIDTAPFFFRAEQVLDNVFKEEFIYTEKYQELMHKLPENLIEYEFAQQAGLMLPTNKN